MRNILYISIIGLFSFFWLKPECGLPPSGIGPLFSIGHSILAKKMFAFSQAAAFSKEKPHSAFLTVSECYYGLTNKLTLIGTVPIVSQKPLLKKGPTTGLGDIHLHANYRIFANKTDEYRYRILGAAGIKLPTSTVAARTFYSLNTTSFFLGVMQDAMTPHWYLYSDFATILPTKRHNIKFGNFLIFNIGIGRIFCWNPSKEETYITLFTELTNIYERPTKINEIPNLKTGGNILFCGPTLRFQHKDFLMQAGVQFNTSQFSRNEDETVSYIAAMFVAYAFW